MTNLKWRKSSYTTSNGGECVELAEVPGVILVRDSKDPDGPRLSFTAAEFRRFAEGVKNA